LSGLQLVDVYPFYLIFFAKFLLFFFSKKEKLNFLFKEKMKIQTLFFFTNPFISSPFSKKKN